MVTSGASSSAIVQETLQNVVKHAGATRVDVTLMDDGDAVTLTVTDDGVGFDASAAARPTCFGLAGINERAGLIGARLLVRSTVGHGTTITVRLPADRVSPTA